MPRRNDFYREWAYFGSQYQVIVNHCREAKEIGKRSSCIHTQEQRTSSYLLWVLGFLHPYRVQDCLLRGMLPLTVLESSHLNLYNHNATGQSNPDNLSLGLSSKVILNFPKLMKLTTTDTSTSDPRKMAD